MKDLKILAYSAIAAILIIAVDVFMQGAPSASLLLTLAFGVAVVQGCIALVAAGDLSNGKWISPIKKSLLSVYPLLLILAGLFLFLQLHLEIYPWSDKSGLWFNKWFFMSRNFIVLLLSFFVARKFAAESLDNSTKKGVWAALYILIFVVSQSLIAFDWVMSLEYPWISTLFGGYFFIESIYTGIACAGIFLFFLLRKENAENRSTIYKTLKDVATLTFGWSLLWAGLFYAQYLVIWYGNIPEEVSYLGSRVTKSPLQELSIFVLIALFIIPFIALFPKRVKSSSIYVAVIGVIILAGILVERVVFILPAAPLSFVVLIVEILLTGFLFVLVVRNNVKAQRGKTITY